MVATSNPDAALAGLRALEAGGNACDAALAAAGVLVVTEPYQCAPGGDLFAIVVRDGEPPVGLNASGRAPAEPGDELPEEFGPRSVTVPGCVAGWTDLAARFSRRGLAAALAPGIALARDGFEIQPKAGRHWRACRADLEGDARGRVRAGLAVSLAGHRDGARARRRGDVLHRAGRRRDRVGLVARRRPTSRRTRTTGSSRSSSPTATGRCSSCRRTARARSRAGRSRGSGRPIRPPRSRRSPPRTRAATRRSAARRTSAPPTARGWRCRSSSRSTTASARGCSCRASGSCSRTGAPGSCSTPGHPTSSPRPSGRSTRSSRPRCSGRTAAGRRCSA